MKSTKACGISKLRGLELHDVSGDFLSQGVMENSNHYDGLQMHYELCTKSQRPNNSYGARVAGVMRD